MRWPAPRVYDLYSDGTRSCRIGQVPRGHVMQDKLFNWLHDLAVALGLIPPMQPVPIPTEDERKRRQPRR